MASLELFLSEKANQDSSNQILVLIDYLNLSTSVKVTKTTEGSLTTYGQQANNNFLVVDNKVVETTTNGILERIANGTPFYKILFGKDKEESLMISNFLSDLSKYSNLEFSNNYMQTRTYTINQHITICDLSLYMILIGSLKKLSDKERIQYCNVSRFADFIQHLPGLDEALSKRGLVFNLAVVQSWNSLGDSASSNADGKKKNKREDKLKAKEEYFKKQEESKTNEPNNNGSQNIAINTNPTEVKKTEAKEKKPKEETNQKEENKSQNQPKKEEKKPQAKKENKQPPKKAECEDALPDISKLDIRVGKIVKIYPNEESDKLYNEEIDIGNGEIRTIASGLKRRIPIDVLMDSYVIVLCNLKGRKLCNYFSHGMVTFNII
jgi:methionine--tRNA ligase beta chain